MQAEAERKQSEWLRDASLDRYAIKGTEEDWEQALASKEAKAGSVSVKTGSVKDRAGGGAAGQKKRKGGSGGEGKAGKGARRDKGRK